MKHQKQLMVICFILLLCASNFSATAQENVDTLGYSYFIVGFERVTYKENISLLPVSNDVAVINPMLLTGSLFRINEDWDFSIDVAATLLPEKEVESWFIDDTAAGLLFRQEAGISNNILQTNAFEMTNNSTQVLVYFKRNYQFRYVAGAQYGLQSYKRYDWATDHAAVILASGVVEEKNATLTVLAGLAYEQEPVKTSSSRFSARALIGMPLWSETTNTEYPDLAFNDGGGLSFVLDGNYTIEVYPGIHLGAYAAYVRIDRDREVKASGGVNFELPKNTTQFMRGGLSVYWKLD